MGLAGKSGSRLSISLQRFLVKEELSGWNPSRPKTTIGLGCRNHRGYWGEEGGLASIYSSRTHGPICRVFGHPSLHAGWLILPAALLSAQRKN